MGGGSHNLFMRRFGDFYGIPTKLRMQIVA